MHYLFLSSSYDGVRHSTLSFLHGAKNICGSRTNQNFHKTLTNLKNDKNINVCSFDKGNGIVIMNSKEYFETLDKIVLDKSKFEEIHFILSLGAVLYSLD